MIRQLITIERYRWEVTVYYAVTGYYSDKIADELERMGADPEFIEQAYENMKSNSLDTGFTYSDLVMRDSIMVINRTSSEGEFSNSLAHESQHLIRHISQAMGIDPTGEEICYLAGYIAQQMHPVTKNLLSTCGCHDKYVNRMIRRFQ